MKNVGYGEAEIHIEAEEEKKYLMGQMFAPMIVGGFVTVTITSVMIAGVFANML